MPVRVFASGADPVSAHRVSALSSLTAPGLMAPSLSASSLTAPGSWHRVSALRVSPHRGSCTESYRTGLMAQSLKHRVSQRWRLASPRSSYLVTDWADSLLIGREYRNYNCRHSDDARTVGKCPGKSTLGTVIAGRRLCLYLHGKLPMSSASRPGTTIPVSNVSG